jgi:hypothetical protein
MPGPPARGVSVQLLFALTICFCASPAYARDPCSIEDAPAGVRQLLQENYSSWRVVTIRDLPAEDQQIWREHYPGKCPGYAAAHLSDAVRLSYAFNLIRKTGEAFYQALIVIDPEEDGYKVHVLQKPMYVGGIAVISIHPPGPITSIESGKSVTAGFSVITFELLESGAIVYYWSKGQYREIQISD